MTHASGPWKIVNYHAGHPGTFVVARHGGLVASFESGDQSSRTANAELCADAPLMLYALAALLGARPPNLPNARRIFANGVGELAQSAALRALLRPLS